MKPSTPVITLLAGAALGVAVLVASTLQTSSAAPVNPYAATSPASAATAATLPAPASSGAVVTLPPSASSAATSTPTASAASIPTTAPAVSGTVPANADYAAQVSAGGESGGGSGGGGGGSGGGGGGSGSHEGAAVAVSVHGNKAVAYVCDGHKVGHWFNGTVKGGKLDLAGQNGAHITLNYRSSKAAGYVMADGHQYTFSAPTLHGHRSGLYESIAMVHGVKVKFGWIVLPNGYQVGSAIANPDSADPQVTPAPPLDAATGTADDDGVAIIATLISGVSGSGF
jgi:hypothetical protein